MGDWKFKQGYGLFLGIGGKDISVTIDDATALYNLFIDPYKASYPQSHVKLLTGESATRQNILDALDWLIQQTNNDRKSTAVVYYSGHGGRIEHLFKPSEYYLVPHGYNPAKRAETAISDLEFTKKIECIQAQKLIVFLDCCHAGGLPAVKGDDSNFVKSPIPPELLKVLEIGSGRVIIASSLEEEYSLTGSPYSIFTTCLIDALMGKASVNNDGYARILDVLIYLFKEVPLKSNNVQHPLLKKALDLGENFPVCYYAGDTGNKPIHSKKTEDSISEGKRERLTLELTGLKEEYSLRLQKITRLRKSLSIEDDALRIFKYEQNLLDEEKMVSALKVKIDEIEVLLTL